ncbi:ABC-F family ATPase [Halorubrum vacuolatum]|uniref:Uncharacterized protein n=1 Tax=Halorubrum vacuolatum TaxID=63740 RepID=A0A238WSA4_HALVU|nr:hypothetical protein [Halorubrum vacuolatum]SNR49278.1 hypothetical protein SAMN06264855_109131 [Halorubrum vacuolatum]
MTDDNDVYTPAQYREHQDGYGIRDPDAHPHAGIVRDPDVSRYAAIVGENYDPREQPAGMPGRAEELREIREIRAIAATETARIALDAGDMPTLKHLTGDQQQRADISGMKAIQQLDEIITSPAPVIVILGEMGAGKTDAGCLIGQRASHLLGVEKVASNIPTLKETDEWTDQQGESRSGFIPDFPTMDEWVKQDGDPLHNDQSRKLFIGDEFSSVGSGTGKSGHLMRQRMGPLVFKIRKYDGLLIYIAHDESSIHPLLWRVGVILKKTSKKQAVIADKIKSGELRNERFRIDGIPQTDWRYNTKDPSVWSWTNEEVEDDPEPGDVAYDVAVWTAVYTDKEGLSSREAAKFVPFSHSWVAKRRKEYHEEGAHRDRLDRVEAITA